MRTLTATKSSTTRHSIATELTFIRTEQERIATERRINADLQQHIEDEIAYERWKRAQGLCGKISREQYEILFDPSGLYL